MRLIATEPRGAELRHLRNRALLLLGFWRGFRGDELTRLRAEHVEVVPGQGMNCYFPVTKTDRQVRGTTFKAPALARLCPVEAYLAWVDATRISEGAVFRAIDRWGRVSDEGLHIDSLVPLLRSILKDAGVMSPELYSGHSLRRGFATWASANGWDVKTLMEYVGWKDVHSAMRYVDSADPFARHRISEMLTLESLPPKS
ncbi:site-specific integrase [Herbaspirillum sp. GCM10030257]|uniref:site-specific integrase n=1 Tax=Herbaspirillum sp. GCM10030257 TaxID=3273393 RepID=UPI0036212DE2